MPSGNSKKPGLFASLLMIVLGVASLYAGVQVHRSHTPYAGGIATTGTVSDVREGRDDDGKTLYTAVYTFTTANGDRVTFADPASGGHRPTLGDKVDISYLPSAPGDARRIPAVDWFGWLFLGIGALITLLGVLYLLRSVLRAGFRVASIARG